MQLYRCVIDISVIIVRYESTFGRRGPRYGWWKW